MTPLLEKESKVGSFGPPASMPWKFDGRDRERITVKDAEGNPVATFVGPKAMDNTHFLGDMFQVWELHQTRMGTWNSVPGYVFPGGTEGSREAQLATDTFIASEGV